MTRVVVTGGAGKGGARGRSRPARARLRRAERRRRPRREIETELQLVADRFAFVRVVATNPVRNRHQSPRLRWTIELDYRQLKGELGLDHYEGRSYLGFHDHTALVTCAHAFLAEERLRPRAQRPA